MNSLPALLSNLMYGLTVAIFAPMMIWFMVVIGQLFFIGLGEIPGILASAVTLGLGLPLLLHGVFKFADENRHELLKCFEAARSGS